MVYGIYLPYLEALNQKKSLVAERFGVLPMITSHPGFVKQSKMEKLKMVKEAGVGEIYDRIVEKIIYLQGKKKDIVKI